MGRKIKSMREMTSAEIAEFRASGKKMHSAKLMRPSDANPSRMIYADVDETSKGNLNAVIKDMKTRGWVVCDE